MLEKYLKILSESLDEKLKLLKEIEAKSNAQLKMIEEELPFEEIDKNMDEKAALIEKINKMDEGFQSMYDNLKEELAGNKARYKALIEEIQAKIGNVMGASASIQAIEARNKAAIEQRFSAAHRKNNKRLVNMSALDDYYKVANKLNAVTPQFMDKKK